MPSENLTLIIFGATGDLSRRKLLPALAMLEKDGKIPEGFRVIGVGRKEYDSETFRKLAEKSFSDSGISGQFRFMENCEYCRMDPGDEASYKNLRGKIHPESTEKILYYLATPPQLYPLIPETLARYGLAGRGEIPRRIVIEKPFGRSLLSAGELNTVLLKHFREEEIFRIDHYLGKETAQNLLVTRFGNGIFEPLWNRNYIDRVEITAAENLGVGDRAGYYDSSGALRDMVQNHLMQLLALTAMEPPASFTPEQVRNETMKVLHSLRPLSDGEIGNHVIRGQYTAATIRGEQQPAYREEKDIPVSSRTETFVAMRCFIDNWRWGGVPFYLRTGKRMPTRVTEIVLHFREIPHALFRNSCTGCSNSLIIRIQPDEGILLKIATKVPGAGFETRESNMDFHYSNRDNERLPSAYERLLLDAMQGDSTLYPRKDAVEGCWEYLQPVLDAWEKDHSIPLYGYPAGTWGPEEAEQLIADHGWRYPCRNLAEDGIFCQL